MTRTYLGVDVYEGHYDYRGMHIVPTLGRRHVRGADGPALRARGALGRRARGASTIRSTCAPRSSTASTRRATATGASRPATTRRAATAPMASTRSGCRPTAIPPTTTTRSSTTASATAGPPQPDPPPSAYTNGVVTPHASFLALRYAPRAALANLARLRSHFDVYGKGGFYDAVNVAAHGRGRPLLPRARPGHDHGRGGQRAERRPPAELLRPAARSSRASARCWRWSSSPRAEGGQRAGERREVLAMRAELVVHRPRRRTTACAPRRRRLPSLDADARGAKRERTTEPRA